MYIIKKISRETGKSTFLRGFDDTRRATRYASYTLANITAQRLEMTDSQFFYSVELAADHDCANDLAALMIHA